MAYLLNHVTVVVVVLPTTLVVHVDQSVPCVCVCMCRANNFRTKYPLTSSSIWIVKVVMGQSSKSQEEMLLKWSVRPRVRTFLVLNFN